MRGDQENHASEGDDAEQAPSDDEEKNAEGDEDQNDQKSVREKIPHGHLVCGNVPAKMNGENHRQRNGETTPVRWLEGGRGFLTEAIEPKGPHGHKSF